MSHQVKGTEAPGAILIKLYIASLNKLQKPPSLSSDRRAVTTDLAIRFKLNRKVQETENNDQL